MQFGAAVRLMGTWKNRDTQSGGQAEAAKPPELQVDEVEILGHSTAAVSLPSPHSHETAAHEPMS
jgi:hypothetical protein